jgi:hypothetical protein
MYPDDKEGKTNDDREIFSINEVCIEIREAIDDTKIFNC